MADWTDAQLKKLEHRITREYTKASADISAKMSKYFDGYEDSDGVWHNGYYERYAQEFIARQRGDYTQKQFDDWMYSQLGRGQHWEQLKEEMGNRLLDASKIAQDYSNDLLPKVYCHNSNEICKIVQDSAIRQGATGIRFDLADEHTVARLMRNAREIRPFSPVEINLPKLHRWNMTKLQDALLQGIIQGESTAHIADRFQRVANMNRAQAIRSARTAVTGAQSAGKQDRYDDLSEQGCEMTKIWVATEDDRTREEHMEADGQEVGVDEPFIVGGEELMYPADASGSPWNIYNCRCTTKMGKITFHSKRR